MYDKGGAVAMVSVRLSEKLLGEMQAKAQSLHLSQTEYIREAIERMNAHTERVARSQQLKRASYLVRDESIKINQEFTEIEQDPEAE